MTAATPLIDLDALDFAKGGGLVAVVTQDANTGVVLMTAYADREALAATLRTGEMHYRSRSRGLWHKGATSGNVQRVLSLTADCDADAVLALVHPAGPACHHETTSCFHPVAEAAEVFTRLDATISARMNDQAGASPSYTRKLLSDRNLRLKKLGEEAVELATACVELDVERAHEEAADLIYHVMVAVRAAGGSLDGIRAILAQRAG